MIKCEVEIAFLCFRDGFEHIVCGNKGAELSHKLRNSDIACFVSGDIGGLACTDCVEVVVGPEIVVIARDRSNKDLEVRVPGVNGGSCGGIGDPYADLARLILVNVDILLGLALKEVEPVTAFDRFRVNINGFGELVGRGKEVAVHSTREIKSLSEGCLIKSQLEALAGDGFADRVGDINIRGSGIDLYFKYLRIGDGSAGERSGDLNDRFGFGKSYYKLTVLDDSRGVVRYPGDLYLVVAYSVCGKL